MSYDIKLLKRPLKFNSYLQFYKSIQWYQWSFLEPQDILFKLFVTIDNKGHNCYVRSVDIYFADIYF